MRTVLVLSTLLFIAACGRPLTPGEMSFAAQLQGDSLDTSRIRLVKGALVGSFTTRRAKRPRLACRERILPEPASEIVTVTPASVVLYNRVFFARAFYENDYLPDYPRRLDLFDAMLFAHELTHVWQWQNRDATGYSPLRAAGEHGGGRDPYLFDVATRADLLDFAYEQQASIVEEYVCCAALDPGAPRTERLAAMLGSAFPMEGLEMPEDISLPWSGAQTAGICT